MHTMLTTSLPFSCFILSPPIIIIRNGIAKVALIHCHTERSTQNGPQFNQAPDLALALIVLYGKQRGTKHNVPINSFNSRLLNEFIGTLCLVPLCFPYNTISASARSGAWLNWGPFWVLRSVWQWIKATFAIPFLIIIMGGDNMRHEKGRLVVNIVCIYGFVLLFFPIMTMKFGIWGIFKFYIIPMVIYHFWVS